MHVPGAAQRAARSARMAPSSASSRTVRSIQAPSRSGAEARKGTGTAGRRHQPAGPDHVRSDQAAKLPLHPAGDSVHSRIGAIIVLGEHRKDPLLDGLGLAEQVPGLDAVFEGGLDGGGHLEVKGVGKLVASGASRPGRRQTRGRPRASGVSGPRRGAPGWARRRGARWRCGS